MQTSGFQRNNSMDDSTLKSNRRQLGNNSYTTSLGPKID